MRGLTNAFPSGGGYKVPSWSTGTDAQIVEAVAMADEGKINLSDYWAVGDERTVHLSAMAATGVGESHVEQDVTFVLMHAGGYELNEAVASGRNTCSFVVGMKDRLIGGGYMNSTNTNSGSWEGSARRTWCNDIFKNAIPSSLFPAFKQFKTITAKTYNGTELQTSIDWFALPAAKEIFGGDTATKAGADTSYSNLEEFNSPDLFQFDWYKTASNRIKKDPSSGSSLTWRGRSLYYGNSNNFCITMAGGDANNLGATNNSGISPFGCI